MRTFYESGCWRAWVGRWTFEIAFPTHWSGVCFSGSSYGEHGRSFSVALWPIALYVCSGIPTSRAHEYCYMVRVDAHHLVVSWYHGDDEMNHMPWMFEWPWMRWHFVRNDMLTNPTSYPYRYVLHSGEVQEVMATVQVEEAEWRWMWKTSPIKKIYRGINVKFDQEVGEECGSWKGGTIGCGYKLHNGEHPEHCLRRMERERRFE